MGIPVDLVTGMPVVPEGLRWVFQEEAASRSEFDGLYLVRTDGGGTIGKALIRRASFSEDTLLREAKGIMLLYKTEIEVFKDSKIISPDSYYGVYPSHSIYKARQGKKREAPVDKPLWGASNPLWKRWLDAWVKGSLPKR